MYSVDGFLEKNRDTLPADIVVVLRTTENKLLQQLFSSPLTKTGTLRVEISVGRERLQCQTSQPLSVTLFCCLAQWKLFLEANYCPDAMGLVAFELCWLLCCFHKCSGKWVS